MFLLPSYINSATVGPRPKPPEPPRVTPKPPEPTPEPPRVTPKPPELPKESEPPKEPPSQEEPSKPKDEPSSKIQESPEEVSSVDPANKIITTVNWDNVGSWWESFLDSGDHAYVDKNGNLYGKVIVTNDGMYGDPSCRNQDEEGQAISQKLIEVYLNFALEGILKTLGSEQNIYIPPSVDSSYVRPESDSGFIRPQVGPGYVKPGAYDVKLKELEETEGIRTYGMIPLERVGQSDLYGEEKGGWGYVEAPQYGEVESRQWNQEEYEKFLSFLTLQLVFNEINNYLEEDNYQDYFKSDDRDDLAKLGKVLIAGTGKYYQFEEYLLRPDDKSFSIFSVNRSGTREDYSLFDVVANTTLPDNIEGINFWSNTDTSKKPTYYAVKQRLELNNRLDGTGDSVIELYLDGDSKLNTHFSFQDGVFNPSALIYETIFDQRYLFVNGRGADALSGLNTARKMWTDSSFRPRDNGTTFSGGTVTDGIDTGLSFAGGTVTGMMWHMRPVLIQPWNPASGGSLYDANGNGTTSDDAYYQYAFLTTSGSGATATGKLETVEYKDSSKLRTFINFTDSNANGRLSTGEKYYYDSNSNNQYDSGEPFDDIVTNFNDSGVAATDSNRTFDTSGDTTFTTDGVSNPGTDAFAVAKLSSNYLKEQRLVLENDVLLKIDSFGISASDQNSIADLLEKFSVNRIFTSNKFGGRSIDVFTTLRSYLKANLVELKISGTETVDER